MKVELELKELEDFFSRYEFIDTEGDNSFAPDGPDGVGLNTYVTLERRNGTLIFVNKYTVYGGQGPPDQGEDVLVKMKILEG